MLSYGKIIEEYPERQYPGIETCLIGGPSLQGTLPTRVPIHIVVDLVVEKSVVVVTAYVPDRDQWTAAQIRK